MLPSHIMAIYNCFSSNHIWAHGIMIPCDKLQHYFGWSKKNEFCDVDLSQVIILTTATINMLRLQPPSLQVIRKSIAHVLQMDTFFGELSFLVYCK